MNAEDRISRGIFQGPLLRNREGFAIFFKLSLVNMFISMVLQILLVHVYPGVRTKKGPFRYTLDHSELIIRNNAFRF